MTDKPDARERLSLSRWSRRKLAATSAPANAPVAAPAAAAPSVPPSAAAASELPGPRLPSIESLGFDSDFTAFLRPEVDEKLKRAALKQLFRDPRFNIMDGLDTYIDDYTKADPIDPDVLADLLKRGFGSVAEPAEEQTAVASAATATPAADGPSPTRDPASSAGGGEAEPSGRSESAGDPVAPRSGATDEGR